jgi:hypothetical protein
MKRLHATVRRVTGATVHSIGTIRDGAPVPVVRIPDPTTLEIAEDDGGFFLLRLDGEGVCVADTWHQTLNEAKAQARFEYEVDDGDWTESAES